MSFIEKIRLKLTSLLMVTFYYVLINNLGKWSNTHERFIQVEKEQKI